MSGLTPYSQRKAATRAQVAIAEISVSKSPKAGKSRSLPRTPKAHAEEAPAEESIKTVSTPGGKRGRSKKSESQPASFDEPAAVAAPASPNATAIPATPLVPATPISDTTLLNTTTALASPSAVPVTRVSTYSDGGFLQAVEKGISYVISVGIYIYALWIVAWSAVWIGSLSSFRGLTATFPGFTLELPVPLYEGIAKGSVTGQLTIPAFSLPLFPTDINHAVSGACDCDAIHGDNAFQTPRCLGRRQSRLI